MANYNFFNDVCFFSSFSYNKREFDFSTLKEYNDYLEQVEDIGEIHVINLLLFIWYICFF